MTYVAQVPKLKEITDRELNSYFYYESGEQQLIMKVDTLSKTVAFYERLPGVAVDRLPLYKNDILQVDSESLMAHLPEGMYMFDVVVYNSHQYFIVDLLSDSGVNIYDMTYSDRLVRCASLFESGTPLNFYVKRNEKHDVKQYKGVCETLIVKEAVSTLRYNMDYKYSTPYKVFKIVGQADVVQHNLSNDVHIWRNAAAELGLDAGEDPRRIPSVVRAQVLKLAKKKAHENVRNALLIKSLRRVYLVADNNNLIFGMCSSDNCAFDGRDMSKVQPSSYRWLMSEPKQKFLNLRYFKTPSVATFTYKFTVKSDMYKLTLNRLICDEGERQQSVSNIPVYMRFVSSRFTKSSLSNLVVVLLEKLNLAHFEDDIVEFTKHTQSLEDLLELLDRHGGGGAVQTKSPKRKHSNSESKGAKKSKTGEHEDETENDQESDNVEEEEMQ